MQQRMFVGAIAELVDHGLRHRGAGRQYEAGALHRVDPRSCIVDLGAKRRRKGVVEREARP